MGLVGLWRPNRVLVYTIQHQARRKCKLRKNKSGNYKVEKTLHAPATISK